MKECFPVIYIHYGDAAYLKHTLNSIKITNPSKRVILLGDDRNKYLEKLIGIEHYFFDDYSSGVETELFDKVFRVIKGEKHEFNKIDGTDFWTKFVFKRWFNIYNFITKNNINKFWTFDSDNLIFTDLEKFEMELSKYENTEQCNGMCMNGFISNSNTVKRYIDKINELFQNEKYLNKQLEEFKINKNFAFTEMRAYVTYKEDTNLNAIRLSDNYNDIFFDDCICREHAMEMVVLKNGSRVKQLYLGSLGQVYVKSQITQTLIPCANLNMSWVTNRLIERLYNHIKNKPNISKPTLMNMNDESWFKIYNKVYNKIIKYFNAK